MKSSALIVDKWDILIITHIISKDKLWNDLQWCGELQFLSFDDSSTQNSALFFLINYLERF